MPLGDESKPELLNGLDRAEKVVLQVYAWVLVGLVAFVGVLAVGVFADLRVGLGTQGEWFYVTIALLVFVGWIVSQYTTIGQRLLRPSSDAPAPMRVESRIVGADGRTFTFSLDGGLRPVDPEPSPTSAPAAPAAPSLPDEDQLDDEATARATVLLGVGHELDQVCRTLNPHYALWDEARKTLYRQYVQERAAARRV